MTNPVVAIRRQVDSDGNPKGRGCWVWCPGCDEAHRPQIAGEAGDLPDGPCWDWNGESGDKFGIEPSLLVHIREDRQCHSYIRNGYWQFLSDCWHPLAGQEVKLVPLPDWLVR